jgi:hypothetical protein
MSVRDTSLEAYQDILPTLSDRQKVVLAIVSRPMCNYQIAEKLAWPINRVTGRVTELCEKGLLFDDGKRPGPPSGRNVHYWKTQRKETLF